MASQVQTRTASEADEDPDTEAGLSDRGRGVSSKVRSVSITWEDLWVKVPDKKNGSRSILCGLTGYAKPGQVLAVMGPSGSGKSTLLDALAGRLDSKARRTGEILVNGRRQPLAYGTSAYVTQEDVLTWTLTVREAVYCSAQLQLPDSIPLSEKRDRAEATIREMGLQDVMDTRIGGWGSKGLSNGQKRRVSICIEILTRPRLLFLDEPTSGLDSAASYYVMKRIVELAKQNSMVVIASVHQPSSEVFGLFEDLCLLSLGSMVYFGPSTEAREFFSVNGFPCPSHQNPSDHYLRTINTDFDEDKDQMFGGETSSTEEVIKVLVRSYKSSDTYARVRSQISEINRLGGDALLEKGNQACFFTQCGILTRRSFLNMNRDPGYYWLRLVIYIALGFGLGTVFYNIGSGYSSIQARGSMLMFVASFLTILAIGGFPSFVEDLKVFERERLNGHYGSAVFVLGNTLSSMPFLIVISLIPGAITYYLAGLQQSIDHFTYFALTLFACMMLVESLMMIVASLMPNFLMGLITGAGIQGLMILSGGFFRLPNDLPRILWRYPLYYIAFHKYAYQGLFKNEFEGLTLPRNIPSMGQGFVSSEEILRDVWQVEMSYSKWTNLGILFGMVIVYRAIFFGVLKLAENFNPVLREIMSVSHRRVEKFPVNPYSELAPVATYDGDRGSVTRTDRRVLALDIN